MMTIYTCQEQDEGNPLYFLIDEEKLIEAKIIKVLNENYHKPKSIYVDLLQRLVIFKYANDTEELHFMDFKYIGLYRVVNKIPINERPPTIPGAHSLPKIEGFWTFTLEGGYYSDCISAPNSKSLLMRISNSDGMFNYNTQTFSSIIEYFEKWDVCNPLVHFLAERV